MTAKIWGLYDPKRRKSVNQAAGGALGEASWDTQARNQVEAGDGKATRLSNAYMLGESSIRPTLRFTAIIGRFPRGLIACWLG